MEWPLFLLYNERTNQPTWGVLVMSIGRWLAMFVRCWFNLNFLWCSRRAAEGADVSSQHDSRISRAVLPATHLSKWPVQEEIHHSLDWIQPFKSRLKRGSTFFLSDLIIIRIHSFQNIQKEIDGSFMQPWYKSVSKTN